MCAGARVAILFDFYTKAERRLVCSSVFLLDHWNRFGGVSCFFFSSRLFVIIETAALKTHCSTVLRVLCVSDKRRYVRN